MYKSKREVDKFVKDLNEKYKSDSDRSLKGFTIAKLYFNVGDFNTAIVYLDSYDTVRKSSSQSLKLRGQIYQAQSASAEPSDRSRLQSLALKAFRQSVELDLSQTDLLLVIAELMASLPIEEQGKARYWLEKAEAIFPQNKTIKKLREKINCANDGIEFEEMRPEDDSKEELNGNGAHGDSDDNSAFWSANTGGGTSFLNNSIARLEMRTETTSTPRFSGGTPGQTRRFVPRPSPERLAAQVRNFEANQEKLLGHIQETNRSLVEVNEAILKELNMTRENFVKSINEQVKCSNAIVTEMQCLREETGRQLRDNTRALKDVKSELVNLCEDMMRQLKSLVVTMKASKDEVDEEKTQALKASVKSEPSDVNDLLMQQFLRLPPYQQLAMMQMSMLPTMLPNVAPPALPGLPIIQPPQMAGLGNVGGQPPQMPGLGNVGGQATHLPVLGNVGGQSPQMPGLGNVGGQTPRVVSASPVQPSAKPLASPLVSSSLAVSKASEVSDAKDSPFSTFASSPFSMAGLTPLPKQADPKPSQPFNNFFATLNADKTPSSSFLSSSEKTLSSSFGFSTPTAPVTPAGSTFSFAGAAADAAQRASVAEENDDNVHDESAEHDPHFEPIIPLPELVEVKTGEEEEVEMFANKGKVYRYDSDAKEWKERGVGILKILKHPTKGTYRVLLRREQVHKIAANHMITKDIELKPLNNSPTAVCYHAMDFAEETLKLEQLAVRFKLEETMIEFKRVFKESQENLKEKKPEEMPRNEVSNNQKDLGSLDKFKPKVGSWECGGCLCRNDASVIQCPACSTFKPGHEKEVKNDSAASKFGTEGSGSFKFSTATTPASEFKFGVSNSTTTAPTASPSGFVFGSTLSGGASIFGAKPVESSAQSGATSIFGGKPTESVAPSGGTSIFGAKPTDSVAPFGGTSIFGAKPAESAAPSGGTSIFGGKPAESGSSSGGASIFGAKPPESNSSGTLASGFSFGSAKSTAPPSTTTSNTPFSGFSFGNKVSTPDVSNDQKPSVFSSFSFGISPPKPQETKSNEGSSGVDLSASKNLPSFADLATPGKGFGFGDTNSSGFSFSGHGAPLFSSQKANKNDDSVGDEVENDHDPHFEPIVPLPELIQVKTGEEEEEMLFSSRGKVFRFDPETKEWKERGLGEVKILKHPENVTFRVLLRREQVHKIAVNHMITKDMDLKPLQSSNTAVCYYAMDFAEESLKLEHLAVRFKLEETLKQFKEVFLKCQEELRNKTSSNEQEVTNSNVDKCQGLKEKVPELLNLDQFKPKSDSWECPECLVRNESACALCPSCGSSKPSSNPSVTAVKAETAPTSLVVKTTPTSNPEELSFENQTLKLDGAAEAAPVAEFIKNHKNMKVLTLAGNTVGINAAEVIGQSLVTHPEFERAHWKDMFTGRSKSEIPPALKHLSQGIILSNARLVELDLSDNAFGPIGMDGIVDLLRSPSCFTLQELRLNNTGCGVTGGKVLAETLMECYNSSGKTLALKVFVLGRSRQENEGAIALAKVFKAMGSLEEVVMPQNGIYHVGIAALADAFSSNKNLKILNMNDNTFTLKGAQALAKALPNLQKLTTLNLGDCLLKTEGAQVIADALSEKHLDLVELNFESNEIRVPGGHSIVKAIAEKPKIKRVILNGNQFGEDGCLSITTQLKSFGKIHVIDKGIEEDEEPGDDDDEDEDDDDDEEENDDAEGGDDYDDVDEEDDRAKMFEGLCELFERHKSPNGETNTVPLGQVVLRIIYDDDAYCARVVASKPNESDDDEDGEEETICNHLIAIQTVLTTQDECRKMEWSALDYSRDPPVYRHLMAQFDESEAGYNFRDIFNEGKEFAVQAEILDYPELDPKDMYYGQGGDYEDEDE